MPGRSPACRAEPPRRAPSHDFMRVAVANRPVEQVRDRSAAARLAAGARRGSMGRAAIEDGSAHRWSTRMAIRSAPLAGRSAGQPGRTAPARRQVPTRPSWTGSSTARRPPRQQPQPRRAAAAAAAIRARARSASAAARRSRRAERAARRRRRTSSASSALNAGAMIHVHAVRDFMRDDLAAHVAAGRATAANCSGSRPRAEQLPQRDDGIADR